MAAAAPDLISDQSDVVLGTIVSLLPTKDGCRTQALSRRWRHIWRSAPLNLDDIAGQGLSANTISQILSGHLGTVRRISIKAAYDARFSSRDVDLASVQELDLGYNYKDCLWLPAYVSPRAFHVATFTRFGRQPNFAIDFPSLERLNLYELTLTEEILASVLSGCPVLKHLVLLQIVGSHRLRVSSPSLRTFSFRSPSDKTLVTYSSTVVKVQELIIDDAPCLESLLLPWPDHGPATVRVLRAPKLEALGYLSKGTSLLQLGTTVFQNMISASLTTTMPTVKVLALSGIGPDLDAVLDILKCFPCLERLYIMLDPYVNRLQPPKNKKYVRKYALPGDPIQCLGFHLKRMALRAYYGNGTEVDFVRFFVLNAKVLERMELLLSHDYGDEWMKKQYIELQLQDKASRGARFQFKGFSSSHARNNKKNIHDLSIVDPFNASFLADFAPLREV